MIILTVDPQDMVNAIRAVGPEHFMLFSDAGIPLLPQTVEGLPPDPLPGRQRYLGFVTP